MQQRDGVSVETVGGIYQTDDVQFPPNNINHTRLSVPHNGVKKLEFDCIRVEVTLYPEGLTTIHITSESADGRVVTEISMGARTEYVLSRSVRKCGSETP